MSFVLTNGLNYITESESGRTLKVRSIEDGMKFCSMDEALEKKKHNPTKCKGYYILDDETMQRYTKRKRKIYPYEVRKMIYDNAEGRCTLCGRKILYEDMTIDHVIPLAMGGADEVENLTCACRTCNEFKGSIRPADFKERITTIFIYQMEKKNHNKILWKACKLILENL